MFSILWMKPGLSSADESLGRAVDCSRREERSGARLHLAYLSFIFAQLCRYRMPALLRNSALMSMSSQTRPWSVVPDV